MRAGLAGLIAAERPDVLVVGREPLAAIAAPLAAAEQIPCAVWVHGMPSQHLILGRDYPAQLGRALVRGLRTADRLVTASRHLASGLAIRFGLDVRVVPNPVQVDRFSPRPSDPGLRRELAIAEDDVVVVHASNLKPIKRAQDLVESAAIALRSDPRLVYVVVGDGPCRRDIEEACTRSGIARRFRFVGWVSHLRVADFLRLADIVALPSEYENQALVALETQACARVLLASDVPGVAGGRRGRADRAALPCRRRGPLGRKDPRSRSRPGDARPHRPRRSGAYGGPRARSGRARAREVACRAGAKWPLDDRPEIDRELADAPRDEGLDLGEHSGEAVETKRRRPSQRAPVEESRYRPRP